MPPLIVEQTDLDRLVAEPDCVLETAARPA
jgi:hypothetical protein